MYFSTQEINAETDRLYKKLSKVKRAYERCLEIAPMTLEINEPKKQQEAIILAHSYQTPEIIYGYEAGSARISPAIASWSTA